MAVVIKKGRIGAEDIRFYTSASPTFSRNNSSGDATSRTSVSATNIPLSNASAYWSANTSERAHNEVVSRYIGVEHSTATFAAGAGVGSHDKVMGFKNALAATSIQAAASNAFLADGVARIVIPEGTYTQATPIQLPRKCFIFGNGRGTILRASGTINTSRVLSISGSVAATNSSLGANATADTHVVSVADGTKFAADDYIIVRGSSLPTAANATMELHQVKAVTGNDLTTHGQLIHTFQATGVINHASLVYPAELYMDNLTIDSMSVIQGIGLAATYLVKSVIGSGVQFRGNYQGAVEVFRSDGNQFKFSAFNQTGNAASQIYAVYMTDNSHNNAIHMGKRIGRFKDVSDSDSKRNFIWGVTWNGSYAASNIDGMIQATNSMLVHGPIAFDSSIRLNAGATVTGEVDSTSVKINTGMEIAAGATVTGDLSVHGSIDYAGANTPGWVSNLGMTLAAGVVTVTDAGGAALSAANPGYVAMNSTTGGLLAVLKATAPASFNDDAHASSDLTNHGWGLTEAVNWAEDVPFFLYVVNRANSALDGSDGNSAFFIAKVPHHHTTPSNADWIGDTDAIPVEDKQPSIILLGAYTQANYTSLPCQLIGCFRMQWSTATDDWTVQSFGNMDGIGRAQLNKIFAETFTFPEGQVGASAGTHMKPNGGTAPEFATASYYYQIGEDGRCNVGLAFDSDGGANGAGAFGAQLVLPYVTAGDFTILGTNLPDRQEGILFMSGSSNIQLVRVVMSSDDYYGILFRTDVDGIQIQLAEFSAPGRALRGNFSYYVNREDLL